MIVQACKTQLRFPVSNATDRQIKESSTVGYLCMLAYGLSANCIKRLL